MGDQESPAVFAVLDSGAAVTVFQAEIAEHLGILDVSHSAITRHVSTAGGPLTIYMFDVDLEIFLENETRKIACQIGFPNVPLPRNILGRDIAFATFKLAFLEGAEVVLYSAYTVSPAVASPLK